MTIQYQTGRGKSSLFLEKKNNELNLQLEIEAKTQQLPKLARKIIREQSKLQRKRKRESEIKEPKPPSKVKRRICDHVFEDGSSCDKTAVRRGKCYAHGGRPVCTVQGCDKSVHKALHCSFHYNKKFRVKKYEALVALISLHGGEKEIENFHNSIEEQIIEWTNKGLQKK